MQENIWKSRCWFIFFPRCTCSLPWMPTLDLIEMLLIVALHICCMSKCCSPEVKWTIIIVQPSLFFNLLTSLSFHLYTMKMCICHTHMSVCAFKKATDWWNNWTICVLFAFTKRQLRKNNGLEVFITLAEGGQRGSAVDVILAYFSWGIITFRQHSNKSCSRSPHWNVPPETPRTWVSRLWHDPSPSSTYLPNQCYGNRYVWEMLSGKHALLLFFEMSSSMFIWVKHGN